MISSVCSSSFGVIGRMNGLNFGLWRIWIVVFGCLGIVILNWLLGLVVVWVNGFYFLLLINFI